MNEQEHLNEIRQDNKKALPKFFLIIVCSLAVGALLGFGGTWLAGTGAKAGLAAAGVWFSRNTAPWLLGLTALASAAAFVLQTRFFRKAMAAWDGEDETELNRIDSRLSVFLWFHGVNLVAGYAMFPPAVVGALGRDRISGPILVLAALVVLMVFSTPAQQKAVDATRQLYPEKQGSVYSTRFQKTWLESCDEAEKLIIGQCAYKAFQAVNRVCLILWVVFALGILMLDTGMMAMFTVCLIWIVSQSVYHWNAARLSKPGVRVS